MYSIDELKVLEQQFGSPIYLFRVEDFINNYKDFVACFEKYYSKYQLSYSYKTNYTPYIAKLVKKMGGYAEVVLAACHVDHRYVLMRAVGFVRHKISKGRGTAVKSLLCQARCRNDICTCVGRLQLAKELSCIFLTL